MNQPSVLCVMLANGRQKMVARAIRCFRAQSYANRRLLIYDTSPDSLEDLADHVGITIEDDPFISIVESQALNHHGIPKTVGYLRNRANTAAGDVDIIAHWDSDDWSAPERLANQVKLLQARGAECVGYDRLLFWREATQQAYIYSAGEPRLCPGTTLCYWRRTWEHRPFPDVKVGEDGLWAQSLRVAARRAPGEMIAVAHGENTNTAYASGIFGCKEFTRTPEWDERVKATLEPA